MPTTTLAAPPPGAATVTSEPTPVLAKQVNSRGLCTRARIDAENDPWFPATRVEADLEVLARRACAGCPVMAECLELTLRTESQFKDQRSRINGIFGGRAPHERIALLQARRAGEPR